MRVQAQMYKTLGTLTLALSRRERGQRSMTKKVLCFCTRERHQHVAKQLPGVLVNTAHGMQGIVRAGLLLKHILHMPAILPRNVPYTPPLGEPRFALVFLTLSGRLQDR